MADNFNLDKHTFTDSRICSMAQLLWNFDKHNKFIVDTLNNKEYYEIRADNTDITMLLFKEDVEKYLVQDKYSFLMFLYIIQTSPEMFEKGDKSIIVDKDDIVQKFNIDVNKFSPKRCFEALNKLMSLRVTYDYKDKKGNDRRRISYLVQSIDYDKKSPMKGCKITISNWLQDMFSNVKYLRNKFYEGTIDYTPFIKATDDKPECMNLPQKFVELYRINENKKRITLKYDNSKYFTELLNTTKVLKRQLIERTVDNINTSLKKANLKLIFDCDFTPKKFEKGHFRIVPLDFKEY